MASISGQHHQLLHISDNKSFQQRNACISCARDEITMRQSTPRRCIRSQRPSTAAESSKRLPARPASTPFFRCAFCKARPLHEVIPQNVMLRRPRQTWAHDMYDVMTCSLPQYGHGVGGWILLAFSASLAIPAPQSVQHVRPGLQQAAAILQAIGAVVGGLDLVGRGVGEL